MNDKIRAVIIDDEETAIDNLCFELKKYPWISVEGIAYNGKAGIRLLEKERPDLLFLDVELPDMLGMDLAIKVHEQQKLGYAYCFLYRIQQVSDRCLA